MEENEKLHKIRSEIEKAKQEKQQAERQLVRAENRLKYRENMSRKARKERDNPHVHVLCPIRPMNTDGTWGEKQRREYLFDEDGKPVLDGKGHQKFNAVPTTDWGRTETLVLEFGG